MLADEVTIHNQEHLALCIRFVDDKKVVREEFLGFVELERRKLEPPLLIFWMKMIFLLQVREGKAMMEAVICHIIVLVCRRGFENWLLR